MPFNVVLQTEFRHGDVLGFGGKQTAEPCQTIAAKQRFLAGATS